MAFQFLMTFKGNSFSKQDVATSAVLSAPAVNQIGIHIADAVDISRRNEITEGWRWLWNGVRDRALLDIQFRDLPLASGVPVNDISIPARKTASDPTLVVADGDILISMGSGVTDNGATEKLESAFSQLRGVAKELPIWA
jgi:hypothetical protein